MATDAQISQAPIEVISAGDPSAARISQVPIEVISAGDPSAARISQVAIEVLVQNLAASGETLRIPAAVF